MVSTGYHDYLLLLLGCYWLRFSLTGLRLSWNLKVCHGQKMPFCCLSPNHLTFILPSPYECSPSLEWVKQTILGVSWNKVSSSPAWSWISYKKQLTLSYWLLPKFPLNKFFLKIFIILIIHYVCVWGVCVHMSAGAPGAQNHLTSPHPKFLIVCLKRH